MIAAAQLSAHFDEMSAPRQTKFSQKNDDVIGSEVVCS